MHFAQISLTDTHIFGIFETIYVTVKGDDIMAKKRNIIVGQSGGPTSVINSSLAGVGRAYSFWLNASSSNKKVVLGFLLNLTI